MNYILQKLIATGKVFVYINDILIATKDVKEHWELTHGVLQALQEDGLSMRKRKCEFETQEVTFLGLRITKGSVHHSPKKCQGIHDWPTPHSENATGICGIIKLFPMIHWKIHYHCKTTI